MTDLSNFQPYIILPNGTEIAGTLTFWISEARREADQLQGQYPTARVVVVNFDSQVVYTAVPTPVTTTMQHITISLDHLIIAVEAARTSTTDSRWLNAIEKAYNWLVQQDTVQYDATNHELTLVSPDSGNTYHSNSHCQCTAFVGDRPCWHRAAARLVRRMLEAVEQEEQRARQVKALGARMAERRRAYDEVAELFA